VNVTPALFHAVAESAPVALLMWDVPGDVVYVNPRALSLLEREIDEVVGRPLNGLVHPDDLAQVVDTGFAAVGDRVDVRLRTRMLLPSGEVRWIDLHHAAVEAQGSRGRVISIIEDVTELLASEARLLAAEAGRRRTEVVLRSIVQHSPLAICALDRNGAIQLWNRACETMFGWGADFVQGSKPPFLTGAASSVEYGELCERTFAGETITGFATRYVRADGEPIDASLAVAPIRDSTGRVMSAVVVMADVTEQRRALDGLAANERLMRVLVTSASDAITIVEADATLRYASPVSSRMLGYPEGHGYGASVFELVHPDDRATISAAFAHSLRQPGLSLPAQLRLVRADGSTVPVEIVANNLLDDPTVRGVVLTTRDVTERAASQDALRRSEAALHASETRYRGIVEDQTELVCRYMPDTTLTFVNQAFAAFYGRRVDDFVGSRLIDLFPLGEQQVEIARLATFGKAKQVDVQEDWEPRFDGAVRWFQWTDRAFLDDDGCVVEFQSVGRDVHERRQAELALARQAEILEMVARGQAIEVTLNAIARIADGEQSGWRCAFMLVDETGEHLHPAAAPTLPLGFIDAIGSVTIAEGSGTCGTAAHRRTTVITADMSTDSLWEGWRPRLFAFDIRSAWSVPLLASGEVLGTLTIYGRDAARPSDDQLRFVETLARLAEVAIERKRFEDQLAHQSVHDPLTSLPNRTLLLDRLELALARSIRTRTDVAVLFLDLDGFKVVNDSLGHPAGDELLVALARRIETVLRPGDTVARFGGDEFVVLCEDLPPGDARDSSTEIASRLLEALAAPFALLGTETFLRASIGIAIAQSGTERPETLLRDADAAMYHAKELGKARWHVFDKTLHEKVVSEHETFNALHRALERGELRVFFQPVVALAGGRCVGAEALVRWQHPDRGLVLPAEFIPLAEQSDLIVTLGEWVLEESARYAARWSASARGSFVVSVNLSGRQLAQPDLAVTVQRILEEVGVDPGRICLEITESALMSEAHHATEVVDALKALGVKLAIDDFGTGYSSLAYLKRFSVDSVKIDRSFVDGLGSDPGDYAIVSAVISMAHALGLGVVAEGVETAEQLAELVSLGCDQAQGYFFAPPQPVGDLTELVERTRPWRPPGARFMPAAGR
jgi:diguanylate cyclase (GGDEF)-like protein/PAS domain S-box-containing protein